MNEILISILIGLFIGILTNLIAWWILFHHIVPKIYFSHSISKIPTQEDKSGYKYRFKIQNLGKRPIIDVELIARIRLKGAGDFPRNIRIVDIPLSKKAISHRIPIIMSGDDTGKILKLFVNEVDEFRDLARYPDYIKIKSDEKILLSLFTPFPDKKILAYPVGMEVNNPKNDNPNCLVEMKEK